jgi:hypothetical protein
MVELSFTAQAVLNACDQAFDKWGTTAQGLAAALRAAADSINHVTSAHTLHAIADELEGVKYGTYRCNLETNERS